LPSAMDVLGQPGHCMSTPVLPISIALHHIQNCFHDGLFHVIFTPPPNGDEQPPEWNLSDTNSNHTVHLQIWPRFPYVYDF
jgi:hypothetical protein